MSWANTDYVYTVLTPAQVKLLNHYTPWAASVGLAQLIDEALAGERLGIFDHIVTTYDATIGRDLYVAGTGYIGGGLNIGGGYGSTGWSCDTDGNTTQDGVADLSVGGVKIKEEVIPTSGTAGNKGEFTYGQDGGTWYLYTCVSDGVWARVAMTTTF